MASILIGSDVYPSSRNLPLFINGDAGKIFNDLLYEFDNSDFSIVNLECPLIEKSSPIIKSGPVLGATSDSINGFISASVNLLCIANNHIMDHGPEGILNTIAVSRKNGIDTVGGGKDLETARKIYVKTVDGIRIAVMAIAEHEFSIASHNSCGANPLDLIENVRSINENKDQFDYLLILLHGGNEFYPFPSPRLKKTCHFLAEMGANAIIVQHTHCPGCYETYGSSHIIYGQGNLIFDKPNQDSSFYEGFLVKLLISRDLTSKIEVIPYVQSGLLIGTRKMNSVENDTFIKSLEMRSISILDDTFVQNSWTNFCEHRKYNYLSRVLGFNRLLRKLNSYGSLTKIFYSTNSMLRLKNAISCESHREAIETILEKYIK